MSDAAQLEYGTFKDVQTVKRGDLYSNSPKNCKADFPVHVSLGA